MLHKECAKKKLKSIEAAVLDALHVRFGVRSALVVRWCPKTFVLRVIASMKRSSERILNVCRRQSNVARVSDVRVSTLCNCVLSSGGKQGVAAYCTSMELSLERARV